MEKGACYAIIDEKEFLVSDKTILVDNVLQTLKDLANLHRKKLGIPILGINAGRLGFLAMVQKDEIAEFLQLIIEKKYTISLSYLFQCSYISKL